MKCILVIAGSDSSNGAGIGADIKVGVANDVYVTSAVTAITAQNTMGVTDIVYLKPHSIQAQIKAILDDFKISAIKIGMLGNKQIIKSVYECVKDLNIPIVLDPVAVSRAGSILLEDEAIEELKKLFELATVITPNKYETKLFFGIDNIENIKDVDVKSNVLFKNYSNNGIDILWCQDKTLIMYTKELLDPNHTHGSGCSLATAIACHLAKDTPLIEAIHKAKNYVYKAIQTSKKFGLGNSPINHNPKEKE